MPTWGVGISACMCTTFYVFSVCNAVHRTAKTFKSLFTTKLTPNGPEGHDKVLKVSTLPQNSPYQNLIGSCLSRHRHMTSGGCTCVYLDYVLLFSFRVVPVDPLSLYKLGHLWIWLACQIKLGWRWRPVQPLDLSIVVRGHIFLLGGPQPSGNVVAMRGFTLSEAMQVSFMGQIRPHECWEPKVFRENIGM